MGGSSIQHNSLVLLIANYLQSLNSSSSIFYCWRHDAMTLPYLQYHDDLAVGMDDSNTEAVCNSSGYTLMFKTSHFPASKMTFCTFIELNRSYASTALDKGMMFSVMKLATMSIVSSTPATSLACHEGSLTQADVDSSSGLPALEVRQTERDICPFALSGSCCMPHSHSKGSIKVSDKIPLQVDLKKAD